MNNSYEDIRALTSEEPKWWDNNGVPRYCEFHPDQCPDIYAKEAVLYVVTCQGCGREFRVAETHSLLDHEALWSLASAIDNRMLSYGDPPNVVCCDIGPTMNSEPRRTLQYWTRMSAEHTEPLDGNAEVMIVKPGSIGAYMEWRRVPEFEDRDITPDWVIK